MNLEEIEDVKTGSCWWQFMLSFVFLVKILRVLLYIEL